MSQASPHQPEDSQTEFEVSLNRVERSLLDLKERYIEIQQAQHRQSELQQHLPPKSTQNAENNSPQLERELQVIHEELQELAILLESELLSNHDLKQLFWEGIRQGLLGEIFWQIVRFGGLGVVLGWLLKSCAG